MLLLSALPVPARSPSPAAPGSPRSPPGQCATVGEHRIGALAAILDYHVDGIVDEIDIVAGAAGHGIGTDAAVEQIVAGVAVDHVRQAVAVALQVGAALQHQGFHVLRQLQMGRRKHRVVAFAGVLDDRIAGIVDEVDVVAGPPEHRRRRRRRRQGYCCRYCRRSRCSGCCRSPAGRRCLAGPGVPRWPTAASAPSKTPHRCPRWHPPPRRRRHCRRNRRRCRRRRTSRRPRRRRRGCCSRCCHRSRCSGCCHSPAGRRCLAAPGFPRWPTAGGAPWHRPCRCPRRHSRSRCRRRCRRNRRRSQLRRRAGSDRRRR